MARPPKMGLDWFALDTDMDQSDEIMILEARHGDAVLSYVVKLLMDIYKHGYFLKWTENEQALFSHRHHVDLDRAITIVSDAVNVGFFSDNLYSRYGILSSRRIQREFSVVAAKRTSVEIISDYWIAEKPVSASVIWVSASETPVYAESIPLVQYSRVEKRTVQREEKNSLSTPEPVDGENGKKLLSEGMQTIADAWNETGIYQHANDTLVKHLKKKHHDVLKEHGEELVLEAIAAYRTVREHQSEYWFNYRFTLWRFLERIEGWLPDAEPLTQFHNQNKTKGKTNLMKEW